MNLFSNVFCLALVATLFLTSCDKEEVIVIEPSPCTFEVTAEPVCSFNPKTAQTVPFPVKVVQNGTDLGQAGYEFSWSSDADFHGSAISVTFEQLPLTVEVTETSTGCIAEATIENTYWD